LKDSRIIVLGYRRWFGWWYEERRRPRLDRPQRPESPAVRARFGDRLALLVPGVRPAGEATQDQARVVAPARAVEAGASYIILGRAVTGAADPAAAMDRINGEIEQARA
jgi:orotidine-5'-phosphate decarboxylase